MNCGDCKYYNSINATEGRCDKMTYLGIVDVVNAEYKACKEYEPKLTCKDCIHFTGEKIDDSDHVLCDAYKSIKGTDAFDAWYVTPDMNGLNCKLFKPKDDGWESVSK
jgi:hypothetical protein